MKTWQTKSGYTISCILPGRSNVFMLSDNEKNILIDTSPGYKWKSLKNVLNLLKIRNIELLILTHTHYDHAENASRIKREYGAKVIVNKREAEFLHNGETSLPHGTIFITHWLVDKILPHLPLKFNYEPCEPDIQVDLRFDLKPFGFNAYIMHTPGHSIGSQSIIVDDELALAGDSMFGIFSRSIFPPFADNKDDLISSWSKLLDTGCSLYLPSHGTANSRDLVQHEFIKRSKSGGIH
jgi:hydroxyacylglutathione hydrolase